MNKQKQTISCSSIRMIMLQLILLFSSVAMAQSATDNYLPTYDQNVQLTETNLPIVFIDLRGQTIPDKGNGEIVARMKIINNGEGQVNYGDTIAHDNQTVDYEGWIEIKYRGNTSFDSSEKKPYAITTLESDMLSDDGGDKKKVKILGMGKDNKWAVIAPFADKVMFRDILSYELARPWMDFVPKARLCEFIVDGTYYGIFAISERVSKGKDRLNLHDPGEDEGDLTGDYLVEIDRNNEPHYESKYHPWRDYDGTELGHIINYQYKSPSEDDFNDLPEGAMDELHNQIDQMEDAFAANNYTELYPNYIDVTSFIDYMLSTEISMNIDGYRLSTSMYKYSEARERNEGLDSRWKMAIWDYNIAWGNANYNDGDKTNKWQYELNIRVPSEGGVPFYWYKMVKDPEYMKQLKQRWAQYRQGNYSDERIMATVDSLANLLTSGGAVERNNSAWGLLGRQVWPNPYVGEDYNDEVNYLKQWIHKRLMFMDKQLLRDNIEVVPVEVESGWNEDIISEGRPAEQYTSTDFDGAGGVFFTADIGDGGLPNDGNIVSEDTDAKYKLAPYDNDNSIILEKDCSATVIFKLPFTTKGVCMLVTSCNGDSEWEATVHYTDGSVEEKQTVTIPECYSNYTGTVAVSGLSILDRQYDVEGNEGEYHLYEIMLNTDPEKMVYSIDLQNISEYTGVVMAFSKAVGETNIVLLNDDSQKEAKNNDIVKGYNHIEVNKVTLKDRTFYKDGTWNTITLPFVILGLEGTPLEGATVKTLSDTFYDEDNGTLTLNFTENVTEIHPGIPYIVKWDSGEDIQDPVFKNILINEMIGCVYREPVNFMGFYSAFPIEGENRQILYMGADNTLYYPNTTMTIGACRAVFYLDDVIMAGDVSSTSNAKVIVLNFGDNTTSISNPAIVENNPSASESWFTIDGTKLLGKPTRKGLYIHNGKKIVVE